MSRPGEKNISAYINPEIADVFDRQCSAGNNKKRSALESAIRLWINLPDEIRALLIHCPEIDTSGLAELLGLRIREALSKIPAPSEPLKKTPKAHPPIKP